MTVGETPATDRSAALTTLLSNKALSRVERMRLVPNRRLTTRRHGEHLSRKSGTSIEFHDYRDYSPGDDVRFVDWNIFARLQRPFLKLYHQEEVMHVVIVIDCSQSMMFEGKFERARELAAAFGVMGLFGGERVSVYAFHRAGAAPEELSPCTGRISMPKLFTMIEGLRGGGEIPIESALAGLSRHHSGRGIAVVLSDFLTFADLAAPFNRLFSAGLEVFALQLLAPSELNPDLSDDARLVDSESTEILDVTVEGGLMGIYHEHLASYQEELAALCRRRSGRFMSVSSAEPVETILFDLLRRQGWVR